MINIYLYILSKLKLIIRNMIFQTKWAIAYFLLFIVIVLKHRWIITLSISVTLLIVYLLYYVNGNGAFPFPPIW